MSIRYGLLALLSEADAYGYVLRSRFEDLTGGVWPLNIGQVYTTLSRLERDGLVTDAGADADGRVMYALTDAGRAELAGWWAEPVARADRPRDELAIKIALAVTTPGVDAAAVLQTQRSATMRSLQDLTRLKRLGTSGKAGGNPGDAAAGDLSWRLVLESMVFAAEAEIRWLDHCETALLRRVRDVPAVTDGIGGTADPARLSSAAGHWAGDDGPGEPSGSARTPQRSGRSAATMSSTNRGAGAPVDTVTASGRSVRS